MTVPNDNTCKPPVGICPRDIYDYQVNRNRVLNIIRAIQEYVQDGRSIKEDWLEELNERLNYLGMIKEVDKVSRVEILYNNR